MLELVYDESNRVTTGLYDTKTVRSREAELKYLIEGWTTVRIYEDADDYDIVKIEMIKPEPLYLRNR